MRIKGEYRTEGDKLIVFSQGKIFTIVPDIGTVGVIRIGDMMAWGERLTEKLYGLLRAECYDFGEFELPRRWN